VLIERGQHGGWFLHRVAKLQKSDAEREDEAVLALVEPEPERVVAVNPKQLHDRLARLGANRGGVVLGDWVFRSDQLMAALETVWADPVIGIYLVRPYPNAAAVLMLRQRGGRTALFSAARPKGPRDKRDPFLPDVAEAAYDGGKPGRARKAAVEILRAGKTVSRDEYTARSRYDLVTQVLPDVAQTYGTKPVVSPDGTFIYPDGWDSKLGTSDVVILLW
jgi:hypothetical protein